MTPALTDLIRRLRALDAHFASPTLTEAAERLEAYLLASFRYPAGMPPPDTITDDFGNWWPRLCPDCGAEMVIERPGRATCAGECWNKEE